MVDLCQVLVEVVVESYQVVVWCVVDQLVDQLDYYYCFEEQFGDLLDQDEQQYLEDVDGD